jgi:transcriptional regulator with XRE-family HTH domain
MRNKTAQNYLKMYRLRSGLSLRDVGKLLGYKDHGEISRHERSVRLPPLAAALGYELIFRIPVSALFVGMHDSIKREVGERLQEMETRLGDYAGDGPNANVIAHKLVWLSERKKR